MSCNSWMQYEITVLDGRYDAAAVEWAGAGAMICRDGHGHAVLTMQWESAGWFDHAVADLKEELASFPVPTDKWTASVRYEYYGEPSSDGSFTEFDIVGGKMAGCRESRIMMVECEPWFEFDLEGASQ